MNRVMVVLSLLNLPMKAGVHRQWRHAPHWLALQLRADTQSVDLWPAWLLRHGR